MRFYLVFVKNNLGYFLISILVYVFEGERKLSNVKY